MYREKQLCIVNNNTMITAMVTIVKHSIAYFTSMVRQSCGVQYDSAALHCFECDTETDFMLFLMIPWRQISIE